MSWRDLANNLKKLDGMTAEIGWQANVTYEDGTPVAAVARWTNNGNSRLGASPRHFMEKTIKQNTAEWSRIAGLGVKAVAVGTRTPYQVMDALGQLAAGEVRATISSYPSYPADDPVLKARKRKGRNTTHELVDTALMVTSCTSVVKGE